MDVFSSLMDGFATALTPMNFLYAVIGVSWAPPSASSRAWARP